MRVKLSREMIFGLISGKELLLCFRLDDNEDEMGSGARKTFTDIFSKGSSSLSESFSFLVFTVSFLTVGE